MEVLHYSRASSEWVSHKVDRGCIEELTAAQGKNHKEAPEEEQNSTSNTSTYQDLESKNRQLKDRLSRLEMEMQKEREMRRAEKEQMMTITQEFMHFIFAATWPQWSIR
ncbi:hypothetical protein SRHO_G00081180 [Serrasalmus rhombeus]